MDIRGVIMGLMVMDNRLSKLERIHFNNTNILIKSMMKLLIELSLKMMMNE